MRITGPCHDDGRKFTTGGSLRIDLDPTPEAPAIARSAITGVTTDHRHAGRHLDVLLLLTSELVTNAVIHSLHPPGTSIRFTITVSDERTRVEVGDPGTGFRRGAPVPARTRGRGYGLDLLDRVSSRWGTGSIDGYFCVWFEIDHAADAAA